MLKILKARLDGFTSFICNLLIVYLVFNLQTTNASGYLSIRNTKQPDAFKFVCYMTNWAQYRPTGTKFTPNDIDPFLCTHLIFAFAAINTTSWEIRAFEWNDETTPEGAKAEPKRYGRYEEFNNLKKINPKLKTLLAVGGWNMGTKPFSDMSRNDKNRKAFVDSSVDFLRKWNFDGLDLDWEFPAKRDGSRKDDRESFTHLVRDLREAFYYEAIESKQEQLLLSTAVAQEKNTILNAYDIVNIVPHLDFINVMSYDYHGSWDGKSGHNSPLYAPEKGSEEDMRLTVDWTIRLYLTLGVPLEKLILGIPYYGRSFTLKNKKERKFGAKTIGNGIPGEATREQGFLSYGFEICKYVKEEKWTRGWSKSQRVPFAFKANQWVGYDDEDSINIKVDYIIKHCLGGAMVWSIDLDDFKGFCSNTTFPLSRLIKTALKGQTRNTCKDLERINDPEVKSYLESVTKMPYPVYEALHANKANHLPEKKTRHTTKRARVTAPTTRYSKYQGTKKHRKTKPARTTTKKKKWTRPTKATSTKPKNEKKLSNFYDQDRNEKLNTILLAYKSSRSDNEDIVDTWLKSLMSDLTPKKTTKSKPKPHYTRPVIIRRTEWKTTKQMKYKATKRATTIATTTKGKATTKKHKKKKNNSKAKSIEDISGELLTSENICADRNDGVFVRDPTDCSSFFTCYMGGSSIKTTCGAGLMFDQKCSCCNWPAQVTC